jgi:hypothetical protein
MRLDSSGNLGLGVTPSAWSTTDSVRALQLNGGSFYVFGANRCWVGQNVFLASGGIETYATTAAASTYRQFQGAHSWYTAPSGTAGNAISFTQAMTLDASGRLMVNTTTPSGTGITIGDGGYMFARSADNGSVGSIGADNGGATYITSYRGTGGTLVFVTADTSGSNAERMRLDSSGNLGLGVTPSAWFSDRKAMQLGSGASVNGSAATSSFVEFGANFYQNASSSDVYIASSTASKYRQLSGVHSWYTAPSGTAGNAISFSQVMTLDANGNLSVAATSSVYAAANRGNITVGGSASSLLFLGTGATTGAYISHTQSSAVTEIWNGASGPMLFGTNNTERARITSTGNVVAGGSVALATTATDGFLYVPTCAGQPTGTPTAITGMAPIVVDTTNNKLYFYSTGAWRDAGP